MRWAELFWSFLKIGLFSYGGFMSMIAFSKKEVVDKNGYISEDDFQSGIAFVSLLPGPTALNFCGYVGFLFLGNLGFMIAVFAVSLPALLLLWVISWYYTQGLSPEQIGPIFQWIPFGIASVIAYTGIQMLFKQSLEYRVVLAVVGIFIFIFSPLGTALTLIILLLLAVGTQLFKERRSVSLNSTWISKGFIASIVLVILLLGIPSSVFSSQLLSEFWNISAHSLGLLGGGYVFIPLMEDFLVNTYSLISSNVFYDGIAFGQLTPGPIMISMFFFGYYVHGIAGAIVYFLAIVLVPLIIMRLVVPTFRLLTKNPLIASIFQWIKIVVISAILFSAVQIFLQVGSSLDSMSLIIGSLLSLALFLLQYFKVFNVFHVVGACILVGLIFAA